MLKDYYLKMLMQADGVGLVPISVEDGYDEGQRQALVEFANLNNIIILARFDEDVMLYQMLGAQNVEPLKPDTLASLLDKEIVIGENFSFIEIQLIESEWKLTPRTGFVNTRFDSSSFRSVITASEA